MKKKLLLILTCISAIAYGQVNLTTGLVGCYPFSGDANDYSGGNHNGTVSGATLANDRFGVLNSAYHFNGVSDFISVPNYNTMVSQNELSISVWSMADGYSSNIAILMIPDISADRIVCGMNYVGGPYMIFDYGDFQSGGRMIVNTGTYVTTWEHYVFITSQTGNLKAVYRNGALLSSSTYALSLSNFNRSLYFGGGSGYDGTNIRFHGYLDDIRIYNRAISSAEVTALYNLPGTANCSTVNGIKDLEQTGILFYPLGGQEGIYQLNSGKDALQGTLTCYNTIGQVVIQKKLNMSPAGIEQVDLSSAPKGLYVISILSGEQRISWKIQR
jgi:hypothetical protein